MGALPSRRRAKLPLVNSHAFAPFSRRRAGCPQSQQPGCHGYATGRL